MILIDFFFLLMIATPPVLRGTVFINFLHVFYKELNGIQTLFRSHFDKIKYELEFNGQVINLEHLLNDQYDPTLRRIYINSAEQLEKIFIHNILENIPEDEEIYIYNNTDVPEATETYLYNQEEFDLDNDFTIYVPGDITYSVLEFRALVDNYKLASKRYNIVTI